VIRTLQGNHITSVAVTPDGKRAVSISSVTISDHTLKVWDLESGEAIRTLQGHGNTVRSVAVTADGKRAVSGSEDETLKVWDLESGEAAGLRRLRQSCGGDGGRQAGRLEVSWSDSRGVGLGERRGDPHAARLRWLGHGGGGDDGR
jgi:WD40 repeat protein